MTASNETYRHDAACGLMHQALSLITRPKTEEGYLLADVSNALDKLAQAAVLCPKLEALNTETTSALDEALFELAPVLTIVLEGDLSAEEIHFLLGNAAGLITACGDPFHHDRLNYTCILAARIRLVFHQRDLVGRGFPLAKAIQSKRLMETPRASSDPIH